MALLILVEGATNLSIPSNSKDATISKDTADTSSSSFLKIELLDYSSNGIVRSY